MTNFKELIWDEEIDGTLYSSPIGLRWIYSIYEINGKFEFLLIDEYGDWDPVTRTMCNSLEEAKLRALKHYEEVLTNLIAS